MTIKFNVGDEVYIRGKVKSISVDAKGVTYKIKDAMGLIAEYKEECLISADVEDFKRENPNETD